MKKALDLQLLQEYIKQNWFKIGIILFVLIMFFRKDMSFQLNLNTPTIQENSIRKKPVQVPEPKKEKGPSVITEAATVKQESVIEELGVGSSLTNTFKGFKHKNELHKVDETIKRAYLKRFAKVAISEKDKYGIPASIILANAIFHSYAGTRDLSGKDSNNHFAVPCTDDWTDSRGYYQGECYRHYENAWTSFRNHSQYITSGRFSDLKKYGNKDYKSWAKALEKKGYSDFDALEENILKLIETYSLHELDE